MVGKKAIQLLAGATAANGTMPDRRPCLARTKKPQNSINQRGKGLDGKETSPPAAVQRCFLLTSPFIEPFAQKPREGWGTLKFCRVVA